MECYTPTLILPHPFDRLRTGKGEEIGPFPLDGGRLGWRCRARYIAI
jgi:hypothetical protein